ncbi:hypothetical protein BD408DRAFT_486109 [Parasitella parasitica]|nr:hypothetical protein BD408DRAFT_486109 [Parasitella parasitica]
MLESIEQKRSIKFKSIFRQQIDTNQTSLGRKSAAHLEISPPILQHSTSIFSLVSPTRTAFHAFCDEKNQNEMPYELYQPLSAPPPIPQQKSPFAKKMPAKVNSISPSPRRHLIANGSKQNLKRPVHTLEVSQQQQQNTRSTNNPMRHAEARRTVASDPRVVKGNSEKKKSSRRHSCSSTIYKDAEKEASSGSKFLLKGLRSSKVGAWSPSVASVEPCTSRSTPSKIKAYNVQSKTDDVEKQRKIQELEDLITGRRGSTLKLSLTPKGLA